MEISGLYYRYGQCKDKEIQEYLSRIMIVHEKHVDGQFFGYYKISDDSLSKILENPRGTSLTFGAYETSEEVINLEPFETITYLVKSTSRFFLKPDIGEIFDQIPHQFLWKENHRNLKAIAFCEGYITLPETDGEHFLMEVKLLTSKVID